MFKKYFLKLLYGFIFNFLLKYLKIMPLISHYE